MMLRWLPEDITIHNEDLEGFVPCTFFFLPVNWQWSACVYACNAFPLDFDCCMPYPDSEWLMQVIGEGYCCVG